MRVALGRKGLLSVWAAIVLLAPSSLPTAARAQGGIAARYPGDKNIARDPAVIFADDFESYTAPSQLTRKWSTAYHLQNIRIATESANVFAGSSRWSSSCPISDGRGSEFIKQPR